jgi:hypothetical protein
MIARNYAQYLGLSQAVRLANASFMEQFRRMLLSKLRVIFENASTELEQWSRSASNQIDEQLRERRASFRRRRESLERIQQAAGELEHRVAELESGDAQLSGRVGQFNDLIARLRDAADPQALRGRASLVTHGLAGGPVAPEAVPSDSIPLDAPFGVDVDVDADTDGAVDADEAVRPSALDDATRPSALDDATRPSALDEAARPSALDEPAGDSDAPPLRAA